jgi:23S rRNA-/tRNA-specific pseudouridylate synthase
MNPRAVSAWSALVMTARSASRQLSARTAERRTALDHLSHPADWTGAGERWSCQARDTLCRAVIRFASRQFVCLSLTRLSVRRRICLERIGSSIIFEDKLLLVLDKPSGIATHGGSGVSFGAIELLRQLRPRASRWSWCIDSIVIPVDCWYWRKSVLR